MPAKAKPADIHRLTEELQKKGIVDLERPASELLKLETLRNIPGLQMEDPAMTVGWYVVGGSSYVLVCE
ncbi:MAG TPA: hypothetical protein VKC63_10805 [Solirubrobacterales bacterium]|nr:hypothetical protein [Solirubrobacterales bacterium]